MSRGSESLQESQETAVPLVDSEPESMRPFFFLWTGQALSLLGSQVAQFALIWWLTLETGSAGILVTATFLGLVPMMAVGPLAGALIDRWNRQRILLIADGVIALVSLGLAVLFWQGLATTTHVFIALFVRAVATGFHQPTVTAVTTQMVRKDLLTKIQGLNESLEGMLLILSAPLAGLLLGWMPMAEILGLDVATALFALLPLLVIHIPRLPAGEAAARPSVWADMVDGFRFVCRWPGLLLLILLGAITNLFLVPAFSLLPLLVRDHFAKGPLELGWTSAVFGIGMLAGGVTLGVWGGFRRRMVTALCGLLGLAAAVLVIGLAPSDGFPLALGALFFVGLTVAFANGPMQAVFQATVPQDFQGRVFTLLQTLSTAATPVGLVLAAPIAEAFGARSWFLAGAAVCATMAAMGFALPAVLRIEDRTTQTQPTTVKADPAEARRAA